MRYWVLLLLFTIIGCTTTTKQSIKKEKKGTQSNAHLSEQTIPDDPVIAAYLKPYREELSGKISKVIATLKIDLNRGELDHPLGRFAAEVIRLKGREYSQLPVDFAFLNNGGLRKELTQGALTLGDLYELMPFDNYIVIISYDGKQVKQLCHEVAQKRGTPLSGLQIELTPHYQVVSCQVNGQEIDPKKRYHVATINYLYQIGDGFPTLMAGSPEKLMYQHLFRDALIEYTKEKKVITSVIPPQIKIVKGE